MPIVLPAPRRAPPSPPARTAAPNKSPHPEPARNPTKSESANYAPPPTAYPSAEPPRIPPREASATTRPTIWPKSPRSPPRPFQNENSNPRRDARPGPDREEQPEFLGRQIQHLRLRCQNHQKIRAQLFDEGILQCRRRQPRQCAIGTQNRARMRLKGNHHLRGIPSHPPNVARSAGYADAPDGRRRNSRPTPRCAAGRGRGPLIRAELASWMIIAAA